MDKIIFIVSILSLLFRLISKTIDFHISPTIARIVAVGIVDVSDAADGCEYAVLSHV